MTCLEFRATLSAADMRQIEFARVAGVSPRTVRRWMTDSPPPAWAVAWALSIAEGKDARRTA